MFFIHLILTLQSQLIENPTVTCTTNKRKTKKYKKLSPPPLLSNDVSKNLPWKQGGTCDVQNRPYLHYWAFILRVKSLTVHAITNFTPRNFNQHPDNIKTFFDILQM